VRDVVAHLLDGDLRKLSFQRDGHPAPQPAESLSGYAGLVEHLNRLNAEWVAAARRLSPRLLIELLERTGLEVALLVASLPPRQPAPYPGCLGGGGALGELVRHGPRVHRALASPGADPGGRRCSRTDLAAPVPPRARALDPRPAAGVPSDQLSWLPQPKRDFRCMSMNEGWRHVT
jgi:hypothetical protein